MRDIRNMEPAWEKVNGSKFGLIEYSDSRGRTKPCYSLTKTECLYIATKFNDEARAKLVLRWEQLEQKRLKENSVRRLLVTDQDVMHEAETVVGRKLEENVTWGLTPCDIFNKEMVDLFTNFYTVVSLTFLLCARGEISCLVPFSRSLFS